MNVIKITCEDVSTSTQNRKILRKEERITTSSGGL